MADNGVHPVEEDPAAAFLAQQESEIAGIENDGDGFGALEAAEEPQSSPPQSLNYGKSEPLARRLTMLTTANKRVRRQSEERYKPSKSVITPLVLSERL